MQEKSYLKLVENSLKYNWEYPAFSDYEGSSFLYSDVAVQIAKIHLLFEKNGIKKGDKIALIGKNSARWAISYMAITSYQAVIVPILPDFKPTDVHHIVNHSDSVILFSGDAVYNSLEVSEMPALFAVISVDDFSVKYEKEDCRYAQIYLNIDEHLRAKYHGKFAPEHLNFGIENREDIAMISYTSGTTGHSKGVILPYRSLVANILFAQENMPLLPKDSIVSFLPMAHTYGMLFEFVFPFTLGCHINYLGKTPSPKIIVEAFQKVKPRLILSVPLVIEKIYKNQIKPVIDKGLMRILLAVPGLRLIIRKKILKKVSNVFGGNFKEIVIGGAALNHEVEQFFKKIKFKFTIGYGMTECGPLISYASWDSLKLYSCGRPVDTLDVKIDSEDEFNKPGEIMVKGDPIMLGYYKNEEASKAVLTEDGWLRTGDLGVIDVKKNIFIKGRSKSLILGPSGQNIYPEEIEDKLNNLPYAQESLIVQRENKLVALIYPDLVTMGKKNISENRLLHIWETKKQHINSELPKYMNVATIEIHTEEFQKTPKRSIKRYLYN